jgi:hypothetical protein
VTNQPPGYPPRPDPQWQPPQQPPTGPYPWQQAQPQQGYPGGPPQPPKKKRKGLRIGCLSVVGLIVLFIVIGAIASAVGGNKDTGSSNSSGSSLSSQSPAAVVQRSARAAPPTSAPAAPQYTASQQQAIDAAEGYLSDGQGFSEAGLIAQLDSPDGNNFSVADATFAVNHISVNWRHQAAIAAKGYMSDGQGFSCGSLLQQLTSSYGNQFTQAQAEYGVQSVGLGSC